MTQHKHTPGPWKVYPAQKGKIGGIEVQTDKTWLERELICMLPHGPEQAQAMINAQLIANAPALLQALENLLAVAEKQLDQSATHDGLENCDLLARTRSVIENATR